MTPLSHRFIKQDYAKKLQMARSDDDYSISCMKWCKKGVIENLEGIHEKISSKTGKYP